MSAEDRATGAEAERNPDAPAGPGARLREMRERRGLGQKEVAQRLHLKVQIVDAIERDDYAALSGPTYVRGYLRNYAQLVGIPPDAVLEQFNRSVQDLPQPPPLRAPERVAIPPRIPAGVVWGAIAFVLIAGLMAWWLSRPPPSVPQPPVAAVEPEVAPPPAPVTTLPDEDSAVWASDLAPAGEPEGVAAPAPEPAAEPAPAPAPEPQPAPAPARAGALVLEFEQDSWTEVMDADGRRWVYSLQRAGTTRRIEGRPPYRVVLGNGGGVRVFYGGERIPSAPRAPGAVTRLTVGGR